MKRSIETAASAWIARRDAGLTPAEQAELAAWLRADPRHAGAFARHEQVWELSGRPLAAGQGPALAQAVRQRAYHRRRRRIAALSGLATVAILLTAVLWGIRSPNSHLPSPTSAHALVIRPELRTLPDGTLVELKPGAAIAVDYSPNFRRVALVRGEAHFQVAKNPDRPFVVAVDHVEFRAVGTAFSVERVPGHAELVVTEGIVAVGQASNSERSSDGSEHPTSNFQHPTSNADLPSPNSDLLTPGPSTQVSGLRSQVSSSAPTLVTAGNRVVVDLMTSTSAPVPAPMAAGEMQARLAWRAPRLEFTGAPLAEAVALMNEFGTVKLTVGDPGIAGLEVSGYFRADNTDTFLKLLEEGLGVKGERQGNEVVLRKIR